MPNSSEIAGPERDAPDKRARLLFGGGLSAGLALLAFGFSFAFAAEVNVTAFFLHRQDRWLLLMGAVLLTIIGVSLRERTKPLPASRWLTLVVAVILFAFCLVGHDYILSGYDMSRDEQMATFDAAVFGTGRLVQKIPAFWRDHADALNTLFMYPAEHRGAWISAYLPFNAVLRAVLGLVGSPTWAGPLMTAIGALALWGCARRIWPSDREAAVVALLLYIGSAQVLVTGMTSYAMPAHLACNITWLWLFLRRTWWADVAALGVGIVAVGLHQPLMHPMFAAPLLFQLLLDRRWSRAALYGIGYAAIGIFWLWWPNWTWSLVQASADASPPAGVDYATRLIITVRNAGLGGLPDMVANLLRFFAWQHLLLLPLMVLGWRMRGVDRLAGGLAMGVIVTTFVMAIILPYQGHGFGYRYLHGLIGNCILLAVYGWTKLDLQGRWRTTLLRTSIAGAALILPVQLWMAHAFYAPSARVSERIAAIDADYAVIGQIDAPFSLDLVYNPPMLDIRPVRLIAEEVTPGLITALCAGHPGVVLVGDRMFDGMNAYYDVVSGDPAAKRNRILKPSLEAAGCRVRMLD